MPYESTGAIGVLLREQKVPENIFFCTFCLGHSAMRLFPTPGFVPGWSIHCFELDFGTFTMMTGCRK